MKDVPAVVTCISVVSRETVHIALNIAALNVLKVMAADIRNAYITVPNKEKYKLHFVSSLARTKAKQ